MLAAIAMCAAGVAYANCTSTQTVIDGRSLICTTCCIDGGGCRTVCS
jgi:hypothetical protein